MNKAIVHPWSYSPASPDDYWTPPKKLKQIAQSAEETIHPEKPDTKHPLSLAELLQVALINNMETKKTWAKAREAASQYGLSQSTFLPSLSGNYSYNRIRNSSFFTTGVGNNAVEDTESIGEIFVNLFSQWGPQFSLSYTLFDFGQRRATTLSAKEALYYADYTHNRGIENLLQKITSDYYNYLYAQMLLSAYQANVMTAKTTLEAATLGLNSGVKDISDVLQSRTQLLQNEISYVGGQQQVQNSFALLLSDMGLPSNETFDVVPMPCDIPKQEYFPDTDTLIQVALENRPDYLAAKADLRSKTQSVLAAKRELLPDINYNLNFGKTFYQQGLNDDYDYTSTVSISMPIFSGFYYRNNIKASEASLEESKADLQEIELSIIKDITTYRYNLDTSYETMKYAKAYLAAAEEQYTVALSQYKAGTNTILDVISAQSALADARAKQASAIQQWYLNLASLTYSIGITSKQAINQEDPSL
jgi:outer membrane protein TolC